MTTDKKHSISERLKALRDQVAGVIAAAEEEETSVADDVLPQGSGESSPEQESPEAAVHLRASENEITSALRRFTWASSPQEPKEEEVSEPEPEEEAAASEAADGGSADDLEAFLTEFFALNDEDTVETAPAVETEEAADREAELLRERTPEPVLAPEEERPETEAETAPFIEEAQVVDNDLFAPEATEEDRELAHLEDTGAFTGFAELLARLKTEAEEKVRAEVTPEQQELMADFLEDLPETEEEGPDPEDVAKLWEPHQRISRADAEAEPVSDDPAVDPIKEETHVFTDEDLKNLPHDEAAEETGSPAEKAEAPAAEVEEYYDKEEGYTPRDFRPIRRRRYYRSGIVGGIMYFLFVLCVSVTLAAFAWLAADDVLSLNKDYLEAEVYVGEDMDVGQIATELQTKGLIRYRKLFALFGKFFHAEDKIEPGTYTLSTKLDYRALIQNMHHYTGWTGEARATLKVTIPEGKTVMETFQILAEHGVCPYETLMECAATETFNYDFLEDIPDGSASRLEGYLFPDTYEFYADSSPKEAICRFLDNFGERIPDRVEEQAAANGYTLRETIIIASLIEKEAGNDSERATIASVIYNRLQSTSYPYLQIDATIQYAMGEHKESLTYADLEVDSPYNTYLYAGLPPGPIANPGLASIRAALNPESTGYYFYALHKNGNHKFFSSYNEFQRFINSSDYGG